MFRKGLDLVDLLYILNPNRCRCTTVSIPFLYLTFFMHSNCNPRMSTASIPRSCTALLGQVK